MVYNDAHLLDINRVGKITASVAAAIMGYDQYTSRQEAYRRITGTAKPRKVNEHIQRGLDNEVHALNNFEADSGIVLLKGGFCQHKDIPWLGASPDAITYNVKAPVEVKCPVMLPTAVPFRYVIQVHIQIQCLNAPFGYFYAWSVDEKRGFLKGLPRNDDFFWKDIYPALHSFYHDYIEKQVEPPRRKGKASIEHYKENDDGSSL